MTQMRENLPDHLDFDSERETLPRPVSCVDSGIPFDGQRQASPVAEREAERAGDAD